MGIPYADPTNTGQWAQDLLSTLGEPITSTNVGYLEAWQTHESPSGYGYNPLGEETKAAGSTNANYAGVQAYTSWAEGLTTTAHNLTSLPQNAGILAAFKKGNASLSEFSTAQSEGGWSTGGESSIDSLGSSTGFTYGGAQGEQKGAAGVSGAENPTGWFGQWIEPVINDPIPLPGLTKLPGGSTTPGGGTLTNAANTVTGPLSSFAGSIFKPLVGWIEEGAADVTFIAFGLLLVTIGLVITFKGGSSIDMEAAPSPTGGVSETGGAARDAAVAAAA